jgi:hypothetical protein
MSLTRAPPELPGLIAVPAWIMPVIWLVALARHRRAAENRHAGRCGLLPSHQPFTVRAIRPGWGADRGEIIIVGQWTWCAEEIISGALIH